MVSPVNSPSAHSVSEPGCCRGLGVVRLLLAFVVLTLLTVFFQVREGAYESEFGGHPDEAAHYVTGLFVHDAFLFLKDYAISGFHGSPVAVGREFATQYYEHYPKIGLGVWPPVYYLIQTAWSIPFGTSRVSVLILMACLVGTVGAVLYYSVESEFGAGFAALGSLLWVGLPLVQQYGGMMMAETLTSLTLFSATLCFGRFLDSRNSRAAVAFGLLASLAILSKGTGLALALVPIFTILFTRRFSLLKERALWYSAGIVLVLAGPWTVATAKLGNGGWEESHSSLHFTSLALPYFSFKLVIAVGWILFALAVLGLATRLRSGSLREGKWASCLALVVSVILFQSIIPAGREARHLIPTLPAVMLFAIAGLAWLVKSLAGSEAAPRRAALSCLAIGAAGLASVSLYAQKLHPLPQPCPTYGSIGDVARLVPYRICPKGAFGFEPVVKRLLGMDSDLNAARKLGIYLISSDASGEGMFIAELAMQEVTRPAHTARRASKELAESAWSGGGYKPKYETDESMLAWLSSGAVDFVVVDTAVPLANRKPHHIMLQRVLAAHPERFTEIASNPLFRNGQEMSGPIKTYQVRR